jgi:hypothetical protein
MAVINSSASLVAVSRYLSGDGIFFGRSYNDTGVADAPPRCKIEVEMADLEEIGERAAIHPTRAQNVFYTLPHTTDSIAEFLTPVLSRVDPAAGGTQVVVVTRDAESALTISETILRRSGPAAIEVVPITSAGRAGRIFRSRPVLAVAGTAPELAALVRASLLKVDAVKSVAIAWLDDILDEGGETVRALEALLGELSDAGRVVVARKSTPELEAFAERYARRARRVGAAETEAPPVPVDYELPIIRYVTVARSARSSGLRKLLDDLDPPSATIVARDEPGANEATQTLRTLGYHADDKTINVTRGEVTGSTVHTVIFYQPPVTPAELQRVALAKPVQIVALVAPGEVAWLRELATGRLTPLNLHGPERRARDREEAMREELRGVLSQGVPSREVIALETLLREFDATEVAAAALHILERERAQRRAAAANPPPPAKPRAVEDDRQKDRPPRSDRPDRGGFGTRSGSARGGPPRGGPSRGRPDGFRRGDSDRPGRGPGRGDDRPGRGGPPRRDRDRS